jgi:hypothetical protein
MKRHPDEKVLYALFDDRPTLERAFVEVREQAHVKLDDISLLFSEDVRDRDFAFLDRTKTKEGVIAGGIVGGTLGSIVAGMVSLGALATGVGLLAVGPIVGLAAAGGLVGGLAGHGISQEMAARLHAALHGGRTMMAVHVHDPRQIEAVRGLFARYGADEIDVPQA